MFGWLKPKPKTYELAIDEQETRWDWTLRFGGYIVKNGHANSESLAVQDAVAARDAHLAQSERVSYTRELY